MFLAKPAMRRTCSDDCRERQHKSQQRNWYAAHPRDYRIERQRQKELMAADPVYRERMLKKKQARDLRRYGYNLPNCAYGRLPRWSAEQIWK